MSPRPRHGHTTKATMSPTYKSWHMMRQRCGNPNYTSYPDYGGRGIRVCQEWALFDNFLRDMGERPEGTSLGRIRTDGDYEPGNCQWETRREQQRNRRPCRYFTLGDRTLTMTEWAEELGMKPHTLSARIDKHHWPLEKALTTPPRAVGRRNEKSVS